MMYDYSFANNKRDLSDVLSTVIKDEPRFISNFVHVADATDCRHEWTEDQLPGRSITVIPMIDTFLCSSISEADKVKVGTMLVPKNDSALFRVTEVTGQFVNVACVSINGPPATMPLKRMVLNIVSTPVSEESEGDEDDFHGDVQCNITQLFRKDIILTGSTLAINGFGNVDNQLNRQTVFALGELARDLNRVALFGRRIRPTASTGGEAGGLYFFAEETGVPEIDAAQTVISRCTINDAAQAVMDAGGDPMQILCSPGQARVFARESKERIEVVRSDDRRGAYVAMIVNEISGRGMQIVADPDVPDGDAWLIDPRGFGLSCLKDHSLTDVDATPKGFDGIKRIARGELTFVFKNANQRLCRIKNLKNSDASR